MIEARWANNGSDRSAIEYDDEARVVTFNLDSNLISKLKSKRNANMLAVVSAAYVASTIASSTGDSFSSVYGRMLENLFLQPVSEGAAR